MRKLIAILSILSLLLLGSVIGSVSANDSEANSSANKKLWIGDIDNGMIWVMDLDKRTILTSYQSPSQEGSPRFPIGMALLRGHLYVNNFNFNFDCQNGNEMFSVNKQTGKVFSSTSAPACAIDGMAALPEAGLLLGIDSVTFPDEQLLFFEPIQKKNSLSLKKVDAIDIDVPGAGVRGLAYDRGRIFVATETGDFPNVQSYIFIYRLNLRTMSVAAQGSISLGFRYSSPGLATYGDNLIAYNIDKRELLVIEAEAGGRVLETISLEGTPIGWVGALETKVIPDAYDN